nr:hypothetical protein [Sphingobacterium sp. IITKGP-BTPF85]
MEIEDVKISRKKPIFAVGEGLHKYLRLYQRDAKLPITYKDLLSFTETIPVLDKYGNDTFGKRHYIHHISLIIYMKV